MKEILKKIIIILTIISDILKIISIYFTVMGNIKIAIIILCIATLIGG